MEHHYGKYDSWLCATKAFGKIICETPKDKPIRMWPIAYAMVGKENAKTMIQQFSNIGGIDNMTPPKTPIELKEFFVNQNVIEEMGWN